MCVHQSQPYLDQAIRSMLDQDYEAPYEIIIVANNCSDDLYAELEASCERFDNIRLYRTLIGQLAFNLNYGIDRANGEYIVRMDSDDVCRFDRLKNTAHSLEMNGWPDLLGALAQPINERGVAVGKPGVPLNSKQVRRALYYKNPIVHPATAIRKESLLKARGYLGGINCEDRDLWMRMDRIGMRLLVEDFVAINYRINPFQVKGSRIAYADNAGLLLREGLYRGSAPYFFGSVYASLKFFLLAILGKMK